MKMVNAMAIQKILCDAFSFLNTFTTPLLMPSMASDTTTTPTMVKINVSVLISNPVDPQILPGRS